MSAIVYAYTIDNLGQMIPLPHVAHPVLASGQTLTATTAGTNYTATVKCGKTYIATATVGCAYFGVTGTVATAANREWICANGGKIVIHVPQISTGATTRILNYSGDTNVTVVYLVECAERE